MPPARCGPGPTGRPRTFPPAPVVNDGELAHGGDVSCERPSQWPGGACRRRAVWGRRTARCGAARRELRPPRTGRPSPGSCRPLELNRGGTCLQALHHAHAAIDGRGGFKLLGELGDATPRRARRRASRPACDALADRLVHGAGGGDGAVERRPHLAASASIPFVASASSARPFCTTASSSSRFGRGRCGFGGRVGGRWSGVGRHAPRCPRAARRAANSALFHRVVFISLVLETGYRNTETTSAGGGEDRRPSTRAATCLWGRARGRGPSGRPWAREGRRAATECAA